MAKNSKTIQMPSPENYIRTRARSLEIFECLINDDWEDNGMASITVTRKHTNGNITTAIYLVDLHCLGLKDTTYLFNVTEKEYRRKLAPFQDAYDYITIDYSLAHNIIFSAIAFAAEYGFKPHKAFETTTRFLLEEDTDDIELIDIECGIDGKPAYFQGPGDDTATVNRILNQLERTAGKGNFNFTIQHDVLDEDDSYVKDDEDEDDEDEDDEDTDQDDEEDGIGMGYDEAVDIFMKHESSFDDLNEDEAVLFLEAVDVIFDTTVSEDRFQEYYARFQEDLEVEIDLTFLPGELIRHSMADIARADKLVSRLEEFHALKQHAEKKALKLLSGIRADFPENPFVSYLELYYEENATSSKFEKKLLQCEQRFPDYPLIRIQSVIHGFVSDPLSIDISKLIQLHEFFPGRETFYSIEIQQYLAYALIVILTTSDNSVISALQHAMLDNGFPFELLETILPILISVKMEAVYSILGKSKNG